MARQAKTKDLAPVLDAFRQWINRCLIEDGSVFSTFTLWTFSLTEEVRVAFVDHPDESKDDFTTKLRRQLASSSPHAQQLMAELLWALLLFPSNLKARTKRDLVSEIWGLSGQVLPQDSPLLTDPVLNGIGSGGRGFNTHRWRELAYLIALVQDLKRKDTVSRRRIFDDYDQFMAWVESVPREGRRQFRHMLRFGAFPDRVERISSNDDRRSILVAFGVASEEEADKMKDRALDSALLELRKRLEAQSPGAILDFYEPPLRSRWEPKDMSLQEELETVLAEYKETRKSQAFNKQSPMYKRFNRIRTAVQASSPIKERTGLNVKASVGVGNWVAVPWIAVLHENVTNSPKRGVYAVYLFREDMSGFYLTFNQGVTDLTDELGWREAERVLRSTAQALRQRFPQLAVDFSTSDDIDLRTEGNLGGMYEVSTIAYKFYEAGSVPSDDTLLQDLERVLGIYNQYAASVRPSAETAAWIFQANPAYFDLKGALDQLDEMTWLVKQHGDSIHKGDRVFVWESGAEAGVVATGTVLSDPADIEQLEDERRFNTSSEKFDGVQPRVLLQIDRVLPQRVPRSQLLGHPVLGTLSILTAPQGSNFRVTPEQERELAALLNGGVGPIPPDERIPLAQIVDEVSAALRASHLSFGADHDDVVRSFVVSLATKRFAILTGLSGSGKTQLALRFGEWLGRENLLVLPVRPDWTGAEALFGYEDALQGVENGRRAWYVPASLEFMLRAQAHPYQPYLLLLDEMNLAHVERYFADVLSGMESEYECLPNLQREKGLWRVTPGGPAKVVIPRNLFVVGTVNVDETTYMFSPKVLDRANTFEFRVASGDLVIGQQKPVPCAKGHTTSIRSFLSIATDDRWHEDNRPAYLDSFVTHLRIIHGLLSIANFEFGHRVFYEAIRFASLWAASGNAEMERALDMQVLQKVLPRLHGSRRRLEDTLRSVARFCFDLGVDAAEIDSTQRFDPLSPPAGTARLRRSFDKVKRMTSALRTNQFVSFTE